MRGLNHVIMLLKAAQPFKKIRDVGWHARKLDKLHAKQAVVKEEYWKVWRPVRNDWLGLKTPASTIKEMRRISQKQSKLSLVRELRYERAARSLTFRQLKANPSFQMPPRNRATVVKIFDKKMELTKQRRWHRNHLKSERQHVKLGKYKGFHQTKKQNIHEMKHTRHSSTQPYDYRVMRAAGGDFS